MSSLRRTFNAPRLAGLAGLAIASTALAAAPAADAKTKPLKCGNVKAFKDVTATGLTCAQAIALVSPGTVTLTYTCTFGDGDPRVVSCHKGAKKISYKIATGGGQGR